MSEDDWVTEALICSAQGTTPYEKGAEERKSVKEQIDKLLAEGLANGDPYILVDVHGKVVTVDVKKHMDRAEKFKSLLESHTRIFHECYHKGDWRDCEIVSCRHVLDALEADEEDA